jgi:hypothetical protein
VILPIPGTSSLAHLEENWEARRIALSPQEMEAISTTNAVGLAPARASAVVEILHRIAQPCACHGTSVAHMRLAGIRMLRLNRPEPDQFARKKRKASDRSRALA